MSVKVQNNGIISIIANCLGYKRAVYISLIGVIIAISDLLIVSFIAFYVGSILETYPENLRILMQLLENLFPNDSSKIVLFSVIIMIAISRIWLTRYLVSNAFEQCNRLFSADIKTIFNLPLIQFANRELSEYIDQYTNRYNIIYFNIMISIYLFLSNLALLLIYVAFALFMNPIITCIIVAMISSFGYLTLKFVYFATEADAKIIDKMLQSFTLALTNALRSVVALKVSDTIPNVLDTIVTLQNRLRLAQSRNFTRTITSKYILEVILLIMLFAFIMVRSLYELNVDTVQLAIILMLGIKSLPVIQTLNSTLVNFKGNIESVHRILDRASELASIPTVDEKKAVIDEFESLSVEDISFSYSDDLPLYNEYNLSIVAGDKILLIGKSGSGKSTLLNILLGLIKPSKGTVKLNGAVDISHVNTAPIFQYVPQNTFLENLSIERMFAETDVERNDLYLHFKRLELEEVFYKFYDTKIGDNGERLSGGERQRLSLIKSVLAKPEVLFLDEATSALNTLLETKALNYLLDFANTIVCVSHSPHLRDLFLERGGRIIG